MTPDEIKSVVAEQRREDRAAASAFVDAFAAEDIAAVRAAIAALENRPSAARAFRAVAKMTGFTNRFRRELVDLWIQDGDEI